ncbi:hypothetical protein Pgy4_02090 [Pseudomonas savastanoi pv. glycinea str. race 4]|uniref:Uncharacterized protein n=1 Tax=Pseudomonas savastanoi pv. glycinea str. race 4 TaxID=875330 RepID=F3BZ54_PSESG|nr:hypothetical protein Pgy4_02090 [Pseudomonas savastanoi pv. glycinea str. race 4]
MGKDRLRQLKEEVSGAFACAGIDLTAMALHERHQVFAGREALGAEEQQMLQKMRQPRPGPRRIMAARRDAQ